MLTIEEQEKQWEEDRKTGWIGHSSPIVYGTKLRRRRYKNETVTEFKARIERENETQRMRDNDPSLHSDGRRRPVRYE